MTKRILIFALAVSVGLNLWLLLRRSPADRQTDAQALREAAGSPPGRAVRVNASATPTAISPQAEATRVLARRDAEIAQLKARIQTLEADRKAHLSADQRFSEGSPDPDSKRRIEAELQNVLGADGGTPWSVACRDQICKVEVIAATRQQGQARIDALKHDPALRPLVWGYASFGSTPTQDVVTGKPAVDIPEYLMMRSETDATAMAALIAVVDRFKASSVLSDCTHGFAQRGAVKLTLDLAPGEPLQVLIDGAGLGQTAVGGCMRDRLLSLAAAAQLPSPESEQVMGLYLESPPSP